MNTMLGEDGCLMVLTSVALNGMLVARMWRLEAWTVGAGEMEGNPRSNGGRGK